MSSCQQLLNRNRTRILKSIEYQTCYEQGKKYYTKHFNLYALFVSGINARYGITVSRKIGNAVKRNRVKRLLREFFRVNFFFKVGWQIVIVAKKDSPLLTLQEVSYELAPILRLLDDTPNT